MHAKRLGRAWLTRWPTLWRCAAGAHAGAAEAAPADPGYGPVDSSSWTTADGVGEQFEEDHERKVAKKER